VTLKPIRSEQEHELALRTAADLMERTDQDSLDRLEVLQGIIERWETERFVFPIASPAEAIRFRMDQLDLRPRDLVPYLGTKSRVSEILAGERQPTVDQIRALHRHLGIPIEPLIGGTKHETARNPSTASKAAIEKLRTLGVMKAGEHIDMFLERALRSAPALAMLRKTRTDRTNAKTDLAALEAWCAGVLVRAEPVRLPSKRKRQADAAFARDIAMLSAAADGPARVAAELAKAGIVLVVLEHLPGTFLDGAAICRGDGAPVIALTLRHDRIDNFWFTLLHELAHAILHLGPGTSMILDDLDVNGSGGIEAEADTFARDALVPPNVWARFDSPKPTTEALAAAAAEAGVHPAIVAGRWRWEHGDYKRFSRLLGRGEIKVMLGT